MRKEKMKRRTRARSLFREHPDVVTAAQDGVRSRWFLVFSFSLGLISHTINHHLVPFWCARYAYGIRNTCARAVIYARDTMHLERDFTFVLYRYACMCANEIVSSTTERHTATPRSRISISIPSLYGLDGLVLCLSLSLSSARSAPLRFARV